MSLKINIQSEDKINTNIKLFKFLFAFAIFFLSIMFAAIITSTNSSLSFLILIASMPIGILLFTAQQELNYNKLLIQIKNKHEDK